MQNRIYLDHNATTPHAPSLRARWGELVNVSGNPSSVHHEGREPKTILREARKKIADYLGCSTLDIIFNSGASEGNSSILNAVFSAVTPERRELLISKVEHPSLTKAALSLQARGIKVHWIPVSRDGVLDLEFVRAHLSEKTALMTVMFANNETGTVFPIKQLAKMAHDKGALMHSDCVQLLGKHDVDFSELGLDYASFSAHKFYALKGTGFCFIRNTAPWVPLIHGNQERSRRGGTENVIGIAALNIVMDEFSNCSTHIARMRELRDRMEKLVLSEIPGVRVTAAASERVSNTSSFVIDKVDGDTLLMSLDLKGFSVSTGAACSSGSPEPSSVLLAMGLSREEAQCSLRVSLGWESTTDEVEKFVICLKEVVAKLRNISSEEMKKQYGAK
jgi:cysteine desulfurase